MSRCISQPSPGLASSLSMLQNFSFHLSLLFHPKISPQKFLDLTQNQRAFIGPSLGPLTTLISFCKSHESSSALILLLTWEKNHQYRMRNSILQVRMLDAVFAAAGLASYAFNKHLVLLVIDASSFGWIGLFYYCALQVQLQQYI